MKTKKILFASLSLSVMFWASCSEPKEVEKLTVLNTISLNAEDTLNDNHSRVEGIGHSGKFAFRTDSNNQYAATTIVPIPDSLANKGVRIILNFWIKTTNPLKGDGFAAAYQDNNTMFLYSSYEAINYGAKPNEWLNIVDSITIKATDNNKPGRFFKLFAFNPNRKAQVDYDDISFTLKKIDIVKE